jgi:hypothetical protein
MLTEAKLIIPIECKAANSEASDALVTAFGGFTVVPGRGAWRNDQGAVILEGVNIYSIAMTDTAEAKNTLLAIAERAGIAGKQECIYCVLPNGEVKLIDTTLALARYRKATEAA